MTGTIDYVRARSRGWHLVGGRRAHNHRRQFLALLRRVRLLQVLGEIGLSRGFQARAAEKLGVHPATISRDWALIHGAWHAARTAKSPVPQYDPATLEEAAATAREAWEAWDAAGRPTPARPNSRRHVDQEPNAAVHRSS